MLRKVKTVEYYYPRNAPIGTGGVLLTLECGHCHRRKQSQFKPGARVRCQDCMRAQRAHLDPCQ